MYTEEFMKEIAESDFLNDLLKKIQKIDIQRELSNSESVKENVSSEEIRYLAEVASILSVSPLDVYRKIALTISTILPKINDSHGILTASLVTLSRLSNFPSIPLLNRNFISPPGLFTSLETYVLEKLSSVELLNQSLPLTKFQRKVVDLVTQSNAVSVSAPTSAGKSYVFLRLLLQTLDRYNQSVAIYVVPTRALIRQVMNDVQECIVDAGLNNYYVSCSSDISSLSPDHKNILVLTQERLYQLCSDPNAKKLNVRMFVVDEAQEIQNDDRGVLLEQSIRSSIEIWPYSKMLFASPLVDNPEKLLEVFDLNTENKEKNTFPVVRQNVLSVSRKKNTLIITEVYIENYIDTVPLLETTTGKSKAKILADATLSLCKNDKTIVYASESMDAAKVARFLYKSGNFPALENEVLDDFADFIEEHIHPRYELAKFVRSGLAFHFGRLPAVIKSGVEDLLRQGELQIVSCTATMLEGLNMPAKNVVIYKPTRGKTNPLNPLDFWNLAGRAGRLGKDLVGNVYCIEPNTWETNPLDGEKMRTIVPAVEKRLVEESNQVVEFLESSLPSGSDSYNEQIISVAIRAKLETGKSLLNSKYAKPNNMENLSKIDHQITSMLEKFSAPVEILKNNPGILPERINALWEHFMENSGQWQSLVPVFPFHPGAFNSFLSIISTLNSLIWGDKFSERQLRRLSVMSQKWMTGAPLSDIILYGLPQDATETKITSHVKDVMGTLESDIRFYLVKYTLLYYDLLILFLKEIGQESIVEHVPSLSTYLEYGACTVAPLTFMSVGLSRASAVALNRFFGNRPKATREDCIRWLANLSITNTNLPKMLQREVLNIQKSLPNV